MSWDRLSEDADLVARRRPADEVLAAILEWAEELREPPPSLVVGRMLETLAGEREVRRVLEVGTGLGLSTVCLARGASRAEIVSVGRDEGRAETISTFLERAGVAQRVRLLSGEPYELADRFEDRLDLLHLAVAPELSRRLVDRLLPRLEVGGLVTVEGLIPTDVPEPGGSSTGGSNRGGSNIAGADNSRAVSGYLVMHPQLDCTVLPIGSGLAVGRKKRPTVTEMGGPF